MSRKSVNKRLSSSSDSGEDEVKPKKMKRNVEKLEQKTNMKVDKAPEKEIDDEGNEYFSLGRDRRISLTTFKGKRLINIREYYEDKKTGEMKPGKKGITLNTSEWKKLLSVADQFHFEEEG